MARASVVVAAAVLLIALTATGAAAVTLTQAIATLRGVGDYSSIIGTVRFTTNNDTGLVTVDANIRNIVVGGANSTTAHSIIIFANGDFANGTSSALSNGADGPHGCPPSPTRHTGDLGNFQAADGTITITKANLDLLSLTDGTSILGRGIGLLLETDDCTTSPGTVIARGVIGVANTALLADKNGASSNDSSVVFATVQLFGTGSCKTAAAAANITGPTCSGSIYLRTLVDGSTSVSATLNGPFVNGSRYGFHIHNWGDLSEFANASIAQTGTQWGRTLT
eukprot:Opistho-2@2886